MYIIDADTHISPLNEATSCRVETLIDEMDRAGVARAVVWLQPPYMRDIDSSLEYIHASAKKYPDRLLPFGWANPHLGRDKSIDTIKKCMLEYGFYGVKLNGAQDSYYIDDESFSMPLVEEIAKLGGMICFHVGVDAYSYTHPYRVAKIARRYPETNFLLAHMGGVGKPDLANECVEMAQECPNLYLVGSVISFKAVLNAVKKLGADRVCYGSDMPFETMRAVTAAYLALLKGEVSDADAELVMGGNVKRLFKL
ncbi:MAG: amidohydrolase family protein [Oscillospiraceae bacterium]|nr:amidohydrolase family protein [Oscillospiraceae bacterium]